MVSFIVFIFLCFPFFVFLFLRFKTKLFYKRFSGSGLVGIFGVVGTGKTLLLTDWTRYICRKRKVFRSKIRRSVSTSPMKINRKDFNYHLPLESFRFHLKNSDYRFKENDFLSVPELHLALNSVDYQEHNKNYKGFVSMVTLIRHLFNGTVLYDTQHPSRIWVNVRENTSIFVQVRKRFKIPFFTIMVVNVYTHLDDYNRVILKDKDYMGECFKKVLIISNRTYKCYKSRLFNYLHHIKTENSYIKKSYRQYEKLEFNSLEELKELGYDRIDLLFTE